MYSNEIKAMLEENDHIISFDQYREAFNPDITTQIKCVSFDASKESYSVLTNDGYLFTFKVEKQRDSVVKVKK